MPRAESVLASAHWRDAFFELAAIRTRCAAGGALAMMELVLIVCLQAAPDRCEERSIGLYPDLTATACVMQGQPHIAGWMETHPGLAVQRWSCRGTANREMKA
jgi:hypothetical protein